MSRRRAAALVALGGVVVGLLLVVVLPALSSGGPVVPVASGTSVTAAAARHPGAVLLLGPGPHAPFEVRQPVTVRAEPGAWVEGGDSGVVVRDTDGVVLDGVVVVGSDLHGIEVVDASVAIRDCEVRGLTSPYAQGIEIRNANGRPRSEVRGCEVVGGQEGIVSHVSRVEIRDNVVTATTMRAIAVTEMSEGLVEGNVVSDVAGVGLFCGDMSHCEVKGNDVALVSDGGGGSRSHSGHGVSAAFYSTMRLRGNQVSATAAGPVGLYTGSVTTERFPLSVWPPGWRGALPAVPVALAGLTGLGLLRLLAQPVLARSTPRRTWSYAASRAPVTAVVLGGFAVQSFHMVEHVVQVWQVYVAESPSRSGLVGASADVEWVHFTFNVLVLAFLVQVWRAGRSGSWLPGPGGAAAWLAAAVTLQGFHLLEHSAKLWQHLSLGIDPGPGVVGRFVDLVWLHFAVNTAVWVGAAVAVAALVRHVSRWSVPGRSRGRSPRPSPVTSGPG